MITTSYVGLRVGIGERLLRQTYICLIVFAIMHIAGSIGIKEVACAQERDTSPSEMAQYLMSGWLKEREKLVSAEVIISGEFQSSNGVFPAEQVSVHSLYSPDAEWHRSVWTNGHAGVWTQYSDRVVEWAFGESTSTIIAIVEPGKRNPRQCNLIDPRLVSWGGIASVPSTRISFKNSAKTYLLGGKIDNLIELEDGLFEFRWAPAVAPPRFVQNSYYYVVRMRETNGFSVESCELFEVPLGPENSRGKNVSPCVTSTVWNEVESVWVPVSLKSQDNGSTLRNILSLTFDWKSINKEIPVARFELESFGARKGIGIQDKRLPGSPIVGRVGMPPETVAPVEVFTGNRNDLVEQVSSSAPATWISPRVGLLLAFNTLLFAFICWAIWQRKRTK